jgi:hypothetical protein
VILSDVVVMEWTHARIGRVREVLCPDHEREVLAALRVLATGCQSTGANSGVCVRCAHVNLRPADWLSECVVAHRV